MGILTYLVGPKVLNYNYKNNIDNTQNPKDVKKVFFITGILTGILFIIITYIIVYIILYYIAHKNNDLIKKYVKSF